MLTSASAAIGEQRFGDSYFFIKRQLLFGLVPGIVLFLIAAKFSLEKLRSLAMPIYIAMIISLILVFIPGIGINVNGAQSWIVLGGFSFQPSELAKVALIIFLSAYLGSKGRKIESFSDGFLPTLVLAGIPLLLIMLQPDTGTVTILFAIVFAMLFAAGAKWQHIIGLAGAGLTGIAFLIAIAPYRVARFMTFLHPELDPLGVGYHINQAFLAIGSGGWFGYGFGQSRQKFQYLPEVHADSIFAVIAEEMGFFIAAAIIVVFILIALRGFMHAKKADSQFTRLLVTGIIVWFVVQSFMNIGAMVGVMPLTGVPLPFISHGGSALMIAMAAVGLLINASRTSKQ